MSECMGWYIIVKIEHVTNIFRHQKYAKSTASTLLSCRNCFICKILFLFSFNSASEYLTKKFKNNTVTLLELNVF